MKIRDIKHTVSESNKSDSNFTSDDINAIAAMRDVNQAREQALALISTSSSRPMRPEKVQWFKRSLAKKRTVMDVVKLMYDLLLSGEGTGVIGSTGSTGKSNYRRQFSETDVSEQTTNTDRNVEKYLITDGHGQHDVVEYPITPGSHPLHLKSQLNQRTEELGWESNTVVAIWRGDIDDEIELATRIAASYEDKKSSFPSQYYGNIKKAESLKKAKAIMSSSTNDYSDMKNEATEASETKYGIVRYPDTAISYIKNDGDGWKHIFDKSYGFKGPVDKADLKHAKKIAKEKIPSRMLEENKVRCWDGYAPGAKTGVETKPGTGKNKGKRVNNCEPVGEEITLEDNQDFHEEYGYLSYCEEGLFEAEYQGRTVKLNKPMRGDVKKFKVYVKNDKGNVVKVNFGQKGMRIKKDNPARRKSFRARHNCDNPGPKHRARYWSCRAW
jgi:hypothetical protein